MRKLKMTVAYDGTDFFGFQRQPWQRTVQGTLEETLSRITGENVTVTGAGRTDAGVHARGQVIHWETNSPIPLERWPVILDRALPRDLTVLDTEEVPLDFHARKDACWKQYCYTLDTHKIPDVFTRRFRTHLPVLLDIDRMKEAGSHLVGTHDFTSFSSAKSPVTDRVRTLYGCRITEPEDGVVAITVTGNGFLYNMVRIIAGTLVQVGKGELSPAAIPEILEAKDRGRAGKTLPPEGLVMVKVCYTPWKEETSEAGS
ncbi:tRNA pseudouridine(38-40) synthase TruA [Marinithermofilum abyssi]|nr:tRNA pseudouridine(38-40) synthase TruA [Marinithermofilum abyssi]